MISYDRASHSLFYLIARGLCHSFHYFMPFCFPYTFDCFLHVFKFNLHKDSGRVMVTFVKLVLKILILPSNRWLSSLPRLQDVASKTFWKLIVLGNECIGDWFYGALAAGFEQVFDPVICYRLMFADSTLVCLIQEHLWHSIYNSQFC